MESRKTHLAFTVCPEVDHNADGVVDRWVGSLVEQCCGKSGERVDNQSGFDAAVEGSGCEDSQWPLPGCDDDPHYEINGLQHWYRFYGSVQVLGEEVPEDLGPEEAFNCGCDLV